MPDEIIPDIDAIKTIPDFMKAIQNAFPNDLPADLPIDLPQNHPVFELWDIPIDVTAGPEPPEPVDPLEPRLRYAATGTPTSFPFNVFDQAETNPEMKLNISLFKPAPTEPDLRGVKVTAFQIRGSIPGSTDVIVRRDGSIPDEAIAEIE